MTETQRWILTATPPFTALFADEFPTPWMVRRSAPEYGHWCEIVAANGHIVHQFESITHLARIAPALVAAINAHAQGPAQGRANGVGQNESAAIEIANLREDCAAAHEVINAQRERIAALEAASADQPRGAWGRLLGIIDVIDRLERMNDDELYDALMDVAAAIRSDDLYQHQHEEAA